ncbi:hypothetical protein [Neobacillus sp.]|uniref:hypothetical protein n=1 Tax=Neobacillus sp. TaxID=2675273 RepID=UPI00289AE007|nr:hypothetical protein [Neobacillus sp.]
MDNFYYYDPRYPQYPSDAYNVPGSLQAYGKPGMVKKTLIDPNDAVLLLIDNQTGLFQTVKDLDVMTLRRNVVGLARLAKLVGLPVIYTDNVPDGPNGPVIPEIKEILPNAVYVSRNGGEIVNG